MGSQEFAQAVRGSAGQPIKTSAGSAIETNNYDTAESFDYDGGDYPYTVDPPFTAEVLQFTETGDIVVTITTKTGDKADFLPKSGAGVIDYLSIDEIELKDPDGNNTPVSGILAGDA